ncbi:MAG: S8 family serine peptidase, partial [Burkholderiaceae bacterium]
MADSRKTRLTRRNITPEAHPLQSQVSRRSRLVALTIGLALAATGCGGGGGGGSTAPPVLVPPAPLPVIAGCSLLYPSASTPTQAGAVDPLLAAQWHLQPADPLAGTLGLGATLAWAKAQGRGVRVAVIDGPVETLHGDLSPNAVTGGSFDYRLGSATAPLPCTAQEAHGTAVAGIVADALSNGLAGAGV